VKNEETSPTLKPEVQLSRLKEACVQEHKAAKLG